ncbi:MAG: F0F1 ATP synthase subunit epsilon [Bowdeniella nasicola]|nr:F0F1 ATP synthase subunit epsilon [Bowdeniella nasicola]
MHVEIVTTDELLFQGEAEAVVAPAIDGDLGVLPGRQPVLAVLRPGTVRITLPGGQQESHRVEAGFLSVDDDHVQVVVDNTVSSTN